ncbi:type 1 glutamine amidotransferase domain-containing protein [Oceanimonas sp. MB9]|uniref:type 1 glutamine amidotransferase domain-containing protein n=1 Tax=Oceanimonas sp. MB9 TaxID=2588453 RepID=UPI0013F597A1|nr:type 1 glutamine amidotransferase domain-containing protein [Oceanimonas sp. MB9]NHI00671.1 General stress protein 18 [Oceanimonas sp. MB9]
MNILMVLTSHDRLGDTGEPTGFWLEELAAPYYRLKDAGARITLASPRGGRPPLDPKSRDPDMMTDDTRRFEADAEAMAALDNTLPLTRIHDRDFDAVFYPGGHGPLWDLTENATSVGLIEHMLRRGRPVAAVCHGPAVLCHARTPDGQPVVRGKRVTGFSNREEAAVGLTEVVPFSIEDMLTGQGAHYSKGEDWSSHVVADGGLITGQNPASSAATADALLAVLKA